MANTTQQVFASYSGRCYQRTKTMLVSIFQCLQPPDADGIIFGLSQHWAVLPHRSHREYFHVLNGNVCLKIYTVYNILKKIHISLFSFLPTLSPISVESVVLVFLYVIILFINVLNLLLYLYFYIYISVFILFHFQTLFY